MKEDSVASFPKIQVKLKEMIGEGDSILFFNGFIFHRFIFVIVSYGMGRIENFFQK